MAKTRGFVIVGVSELQEALQLWLLQKQLQRAWNGFGAPLPAVVSQHERDRYQEQHRFNIYEYLGGDWRPNPPRIVVKLVLEGAIGTKSLSGRPN